MFDTIFFLLIFSICYLMVEMTKMHIKNKDYFAAIVIFCINFLFLAVLRVA